MRPNSAYKICAHVQLHVEGDFTWNEICGHLLRAGVFVLCLLKEEEKGGSNKLNVRVFMSNQLKCILERGERVGIIYNKTSKKYISIDQLFIWRQLHNDVEYSVELFRNLPTSEQNAIYFWMTMTGDPLLKDLLTYQSLATPLQDPRIREARNNLEKFARAFKRVE